MSEQKEQEEHKSRTMLERAGVLKSRVQEYVKRTWTSLQKNRWEKELEYIEKSVDEKNRIIEEQNERTQALEGIITSALLHTRFLIPPLATIMLTGTLYSRFLSPHVLEDFERAAVRDALEEREYDKVKALLSAAQELDIKDNNEFALSLAISKDPYVIRKTQLYSHFNPTANPDLLEAYSKEVTERHFSTGIAKLTSPDGTDFIVFGDYNGDFYAVNESRTISTQLSDRIKGVIHPIHDNQEVVVAASNGLVYKIAIEENITNYSHGNLTNYTLVAKTIRAKQNTTISELVLHKGIVPRPNIVPKKSINKSINDSNTNDTKSDEQELEPFFFYVTEFGSVVGFDQNGVEVASTRTFSYDDSLSYRIPPLIESFRLGVGINHITNKVRMHDERTILRGVTHNDDGTLYLFGRKMEYDTLEDAYPQGNFLSADVNGDGTKDIVFRTEDRIGFISHKGPGISYATNKKQYPISGSRSIVADVNEDGIDDIVHGSGIFIEARFGGRKNPLKLGWQFVMPGIFPDSMYVPTRFVHTDLNKDGTKEIIAASDEGNVYILDAKTGTKKFEFDLDSSISSDAMKLEEINGIEYLCIASEGTLYMISTEWFSHL